MLWLDRLTFFFLCAMIFVLPVSTAGVEIGASLAILFFLVRQVALFVIARQKGASCSCPLRVKADLLNPVVPLLAFVVWSVLSVSWSVAPVLSWKALVGKLGEYILIYCVVRDTLTSSRRQIVFVVTLAVSAFLVSCDGLWQAWTGTDFFRQAFLVDGRVAASFRHANGLGGYLIIAIPIVYALGVLVWQRFRASRLSWAWPVAIGVALVFLLTILGMTYSRGAWLGLAAGGCVFLIGNRKQAGIFLIGVVVFFAAFLSLLQSQRHVTLITDSVAPQESFVLGGTGRFMFWKDALAIIQDYPVAGTGLNTYTTVIKQYATTWQAYPHNSYLQMAAELGVTGLLIFLWLVWAHIRSGIRSRVAEQSSADHILWVGVLVALSGFLVHAFFDTTFYSVQHGVLLWVLLALVVKKTEASSLAASLAASN